MPAYYFQDAELIYRNDAMLIESKSPAYRSPEPVIRNEHTWLTSHEAGSPVAVTRWSGDAIGHQEQISVVDPNCYLLAIALRPLDMTAFLDGKLMHEGAMQQGTIRLIEPGLPIRGIFRGGFDALHLHIRNTAVAELSEAGRGQSVDPPIPLGGPRPIFDRAIERMAFALLHADDFDGAYGNCYAESLSFSIIARLLDSKARSGSEKRVSSLPKWRLKRATDFIMAHMAEPIGLSEIAAATGLTRMHFAAQFRAATGMRPHEYLVRLRIEQAQKLLATTRLPLRDIASAVGFKAQAHFTTVFARFAGETPNAWRRNNYAGRNQ